MKDLKALSAQELKSRGVKLAEEMMKLRFQKTTGQLKQTHRLSQIRREIARINTLLAQATAAKGKA
jgi:large subunit ribosomal protein L29